MGFSDLMNMANYNTAAKKEGWIYKWTKNFVSENANIMTPEILRIVMTNMPPVQVYNEPTNQMITDKKSVEQLIEQLQNTLGLQTKENTGRSR